MTVLLAYHNDPKVRIPEELAYLEDYFFKQLPVKKAKQWPARFLSAIRVGADLTRVYDQWSAWNLIDPKHGVLRLVSDEFPDVQKLVRETGEACLSGHRINTARAARAVEAAWAAWAAAWAAEGAAEAAGAARAAGAAAWAAAGAAWAAAGAAEAAAGSAARAAGAAAWTAYYKAASDKLIELLEAA